MKRDGDKETVIISVTAPSLFLSRSNATPYNLINNLDIFVYQLFNLFRFLDFSSIYIRKMKD